MPKQIETIDVDLRVKLPMRYYRFLNNLGGLVGKTAEELLTEEVYCTLKSFVNSGAFESWTEEVMEQNEDLEKLVEQVLAE